MSKLYSHFLSSGFGELNAGSRQHAIDLYRHNYQKFLPENKSAEILDIGCGMGQFLEFLGLSGYENFLGVDLSEEAIRYCQERGMNKVKLISDLKEFLLCSRSFDLVVLNDVIEHFPKGDVLDILQLINEHLNSGGKVIVKTGNLSSAIGPHIRYNDFTHESGFTEYSLTQVLKISGFKDNMVYPFVTPRNRVRRVIRWLGQKKLHALWKLVYFFEFENWPRIVDEIIFAVGKK
ncbi:MAG: class I SAM-dependent methyltransferase [Parcubacteria group bacterium]